MTWTLCKSFKHLKWASNFKKPTRIEHIFEDWNLKNVSIVNLWLQKQASCKKALCPYGCVLAYELSCQNIADFNHRTSYDHIPLKLLLLKTEADTSFLQQNFPTMPFLPKLNSHVIHKVTANHTEFLQGCVGQYLNTILKASRENPNYF